MAGGSTTPGPGAFDPALTGQQFYDQWAATTGKFDDNQWEEIIASRFREFADSIRYTYATWKELTVKRVKGSVYPINFTDQLNTVPADMRIIGMQAKARYGVDSSTGNSGVYPPPVFFQLIRERTGPISALIDEEPTTTQRTNGRWIVVSGTAEELLAQFDFLELEDHPYGAGDVVKWTFDNGQTGLVEWINDSVGYQHPEPTGLISDTIYRAFAPLSYDDSSLVDRLKALEAAFNALPTGPAPDSGEFSYLVPVQYTVISRDYNKHESHITAVEMAEGLNTVRLSVGQGLFRTYTAAELAAEITESTPLILPNNCPLRWQAGSFLNGYNDGTIYVAGKKV